MKTERPIVLYDADCGFCRWSLAKLLAWDRRRSLRPVAIESGEGERLLADLAEEQRGISWHFVDRDGRRTSGAAAAVPLLQHLPGGRTPAKLLDQFPDANQRAYAWVADHRSDFSRLLTAGARRRADARIGGRQ